MQAKKNRCQRAVQKCRLTTPLFFITATDFAEKEGLLIFYAGSMKQENLTDGNNV